MSETFDEHITVATRAFLAAMRRQFVSKHPTAESPVLNLEDYTPSDQRRLKLSIGAALRAAKSDSQESARTWSYGA